MVMSNISDSPPPDAWREPSVDPLAVDILVEALATSSDATFIVSCQGILYANDACLRLTGMTRDELTKTREGIARLFGSEVEQIRAYLRFESDALPLESHVEGCLQKRLPVERGGSRYLVCTIREAPRWANQAELLSATLRRIADAVPDTLILLSREGLLLEVASAGDARSSPLTPNDVGKHISAVVPEWSEALMEGVARTLATRRTHAAEFSLALNDGSPRFFEARFTAIGEEGVLAILRDVTEKKLSALAVAASEERFRRIFEDSAVPMALFDASARAFRTNLAFRKMLGYSEEELLHLNLRDWTPPEDKEIFRAFDQLVKGNIGFHRGEKRCRKKNGEMLWGRYTLSAIRDKEGRFLYAVAIVEDVTEHRRMVEELCRSRQHYAALVDSIEGVVWEADPTTYRFCFVSHRAERLFGYPLERWWTSENFWKELVHAEDYEKAMNACREAIDRRRPCVVECRFTTLWGNTLWGRNIITVVMEGDVVTALRGILVDVTERRKTEEELRRLANELEQRVAERTAELATLNEELRRSNADLESFASAVSHDLREPLRMVFSYLRLIERRYSHLWDEDGRDFFRFAMGGAERMEAMITSLLEYARLGKAALRRTPTDCNGLLESVMWDLGHRIAESGAVITHDPLPTLDVDAVQLRQVFSNLLSNAIKYRSEETPRVHIAARRGENEWVFSVRDNGIGIDPADHERIFFVFQRLHTAAEYDGIGVGLAVCKRIIERHGGSIWVESQRHQGSTFYFTIPDERGCAS